MDARERAARECAAKGRKLGRRIDFLGYQFTPDVTLLRKRIKKTFARKNRKIKDPKKKRQVLASYYGWCKWGDCKHLWKTITKNETMSFAERGVKSQTRTKDGRRFFDDPEKKMSQILNIPITVIDFETGVKTKNGGNRYAIRFLMDDYGQEKTYKVITNSFTLKSVLDQAREYDNHLNELKKAMEEAKQKFGDSFNIALMNLSDEDKDILMKNNPMLPQHTAIHRRELGDNKYDFYFE